VIRRLRVVRSGDPRPMACTTLHIDKRIGISLRTRIFHRNVFPLALPKAILGTCHGSRHFTGKRGMMASVGATTHEGCHTYLRAVSPHEKRAPRCEGRLPTPYTGTHVHIKGPDTGKEVLGFVTGDSCQKTKFPEGSSMAEGPWVTRSDLSDERSLNRCE
jgi:hypothetical protein